MDELPGIHSHQIREKSRLSSGILHEHTSGCASQSPGPRSPSLVAGGVGSVGSERVFCGVVESVGLAGLAWAPALAARGEGSDGRGAFRWGAAGSLVPAGPIVCEQVTSRQVCQLPTRLIHVASSCKSAMLLLRSVERPLVS